MRKKSSTVPTEYLEYLTVRIESGLTLRDLTVTVRGRPHLTANRPNVPVGEEPPHASFLGPAHARFLLLPTPLGALGCHLPCIARYHSIPDITFPCLLHGTPRAIPTSIPHVKHVPAARYGRYGRYSRYGPRHDHSNARCKLRAGEVTSSRSFTVNVFSFPKAQIRQESSHGGLPNPVNLFGYLPLPDLLPS